MRATLHPPIGAVDRDYKSKSGKHFNIFQAKRCAARKHRNGGEPMRGSLIALGLALAAPVAAQVPANTVQQRFDAARTKLDAHDAAGALAELKSLEAFIKAQPTPNPTNLAVTRAQQAEALVKLGRGGEAKATLRLALDGPGLSKPALAAVRDNSRLLLGNVLEAELDHAGADVEYLRLAQDTAEPITRTVALMGAARTEMFTDAESALKHIDEALAIAEKDPSVGKGELANVLGLKGRILINGGRYAQASELLVRAVRLRGGLTDKVYQPDVALRADAAIAMLKVGQSEEARKYLAYTGAGRTEVQLQTPTEMPLPPCGGLEGLEPDDSAVIEFTILDNGQVVSPRPVYASKQGEMAYVFARAVSRWSWNPDNASKVKPFFRLSTRVELRCSNKTQRPRMTVQFEQEIGDWFAAKRVKLPGDASDAAQAPELKRRLTTSAPQSAERLGVLWALMHNSTIEGRDRLQYAAEAMKLAPTIGAPKAALFVLALDHAGIWVHENSDTWRGAAARELEAYETLLGRPEFDDPAMQAIVRLQIAQAAGNLGQHEREQQALLGVTQESHLSDKNPLKVAALVQLANIYAAARQTEQAAAMYARTGLSAQQCALVDGGPVMLKSGTGKFPEEAYRWGFEGWTSLEYDIAADGSARNARAVAAFPPRIFAEASEDITRTMRYRVSYRPQGDLACTAMNKQVRFILP
jgi:tetratricopeptide (TPR) repeat protein